MNIADSVPDPVNPVALTDRLAQMERLQRIVETSDQLMFEVDPGGRFTYVNQAASSYFGVAPAACPGQPVTAFVHPDDHEKVRQWFSERSANQQRHLSEEIRVVHRHGALFHMLWRMTLHQDDTGQLQSITVITHDITEMKRQEETQRAFRLFIENSPEGFAIADQNLRLTYTNHAFNAMLDEPSLVGRSVVELVCADDHATLVTAARTAERGQAAWDIVRYVRSDGTLITVHTGIIGLCDHQGNLIAYALVNRDMTSQLQAETELRRSEQRNRALLAAIPDLMFVLSADGIFLDYKADKLLLPPEAFLNRHVNEVLPPPLAAQALSYLDRLKRTGDMQVYEYQIEFMGQIEEYEARMVPLQDSALVLARDVTAHRRAERERVAMQEQIIQAQQATLRELSTPLMPIADGVVVMPLIGVIDSARAQQIMESLLHGVSEYKARVALIDITGVKVVDTQVAGVLLRAAQAVRLLGAQVVLTGISPEIAQTLVHIGAEIRDVKTKATLQEGMRYVMTVGNRS
jgi:rsbT co-antagonist protein RsbR